MSKTYKINENICEYFYNWKKVGERKLNATYAIPIYKEEDGSESVGTPNYFTNDNTALKLLKDLSSKVSIELARHKDLDKWNGSLLTDYGRASVSGNTLAETICKMTIAYVNITLKMQLDIEESV